MNPSWWIPIGIGISVLYLFYMLTIEFKLAKLDDDVAEPDMDVHNDLKTWSYEYYFPRVKARKLAAFLRWLGVSAAVMVVCLILSGGGEKVARAMGLPTPTPTPFSTMTEVARATYTPTVVNTPTATQTQPLPETEMPTATGTAEPTSTPAVIYRPGANVEVTRIVQVTRIVKVAQTQLVTTTPGPTQTPWIVFVTPTETPTVTPTITETPTPEVTP
jgi:hypothetical protein